MHFLFLFCSGFVDLIRFLEPRYTIPNKTTFSRTIIPNQYNKVVGKLKTVIKKANYLSFTDLWSSINTTDYLVYQSLAISSTKCFAGGYSISTIISLWWWYL